MLPVEAPTVEVRATFSVGAEVASLVKPGDTDADVVSFSRTARATVVSVIRTPGPIEATLRVPAVQTTAGWVYHDQPLKAGLPFRFETDAYVLQGTTLAVNTLSVAQPR